MGSYNVTEFCKKYRLCRTKFYALDEKGEGPLTVRVGGSVRISAEDAEAWWKALRDKARAEQQDRAAKAAAQHQPQSETRAAA